MSKTKLVGIAVAAVILILALTAKAIGGSQAAELILPLLAVFAILLTVIDIVSYCRQRKSGSPSSVPEIIKIISLSVISLVLLAAVIVNIIV